MLPKAIGQNPANLRQSLVSSNYGISMKIFLGALCVASGFVTFCAIAQDLKTTDAAISILRAAQPTVNWTAKTAVSADVNCDGKADVALVGYEGIDFVWLGLVPGSDFNKSTKPITMQFLVGKHSQDSFCSVPVWIKKLPLDCNGDGDKLPGCKIVNGCSSLLMIDDNCDAFHFYWDSSQKELQWWRM